MSSSSGLSQGSFGQYELKSDYLITTFKPTRRQREPMNQCPECKAKILWGLADPRQSEGVDVEPGDIAVVG